MCTFWEDLKVVLNSLNLTVRLDIKAVLFGILDRENMSGLVKYSTSFLKVNILFTAVS